jgi:hypothetical protein
VPKTSSDFGLGLTGDIGFALSANGDRSRQPAIMSDSLCNPEARIGKVVTLAGIVLSRRHPGDADPIDNSIVGLGIGDRSQGGQLSEGRHWEKPTVARAEDALSFERPHYGLEGIRHVKLLFR